MSRWNEGIAITLPSDIKDSEKDATQQSNRFSGVDNPITDEERIIGVH
jgi:hypothetical protein